MGEKRAWTITGLALLSWVLFFAAGWGANELMNKTNEGTGPIVAIVAPVLE